MESLLGKLQYLHISKKQRRFTGVVFLMNERSGDILGIRLIIVVGVLSSDLHATLDVIPMESCQ